MSTKTPNTNEYISIKEVKDVFIAKLNVFGIIEVDWNTNITEVEKAHLILLKEAVGVLGGGKKMPVFINSSDFLGISTEARTYAALKESNEFTLANAVMVKTLANKLLFNFFISINKPSILTKGFTNKETAIEWLKGIK